jgi:hypothetical protein
MKFDFSWQIFEESSNISFSVNPSRGNRVLNFANACTNEIASVVSGFNSPGECRRCHCYWSASFEGSVVTKESLAVKIVAYYCVIIVTVWLSSQSNKTPFAEWLKRQWPKFPSMLCHWGNNFFSKSSSSTSCGSVTRSNMSSFMAALVAKSAFLLPDQHLQQSKYNFPARCSFHEGRFAVCARDLSILLKVHIGCVVQPASCSKENRVFPLKQNSQVMNPISHLHLMPTRRKSGAILLLPYTHSWLVKTTIILSLPSVLKMNGI